MQNREDARCVVPRATCDSIDTQVKEEQKNDTFVDSDVLVAGKI